MMQRDDPSGEMRRVLIAGLCTLIIAMGIGRFAYTAILPGMQTGTGLSHAGAGLLASLNFIGYLIGAFASGFIRAEPWRRLIFGLAMATALLTTLLMAATTWFPLWGTLRLLSGLASGALFVLSADVVTRVLARRHRLDLAGVHFSGVGLGIALTGLLTQPLEQLGGWRATWAGLALVAVLLALPAWRWLHDRETVPPHAAGAGSEEAAAAGSPAFPLTILVLAYFLEGFGYIVSGTFLVAILADQAGGATIGALAWTVLGLAGAPSCVLWAMAAGRIGFVPALISAHLLQALGIALPVVSVQIGPALGSALLFGGTFMGITTVVIGFGRQLAPHAPARAIGLLTAAYGVGQVVGPLAAGWLIGRAGSFDAALLMATLAVLLAAALLACGSLWQRRRRFGGA